MKQSILSGLFPDKDKDEKPGITHGVVGTDIMSGYIDVDYQSKWRSWPTRINTINEMIGSDATVDAILQAIINPITSAKYFIEPASEDEKDIEIAEFIERNLFDEMEGGFDWFLEQVTTMYAYGCSVFEKVYKAKENKIMLHKLAFREQASIDKWAITGEDWYDGHPAGITQTVNVSDEDKEKANNITIPWNNLLVFSHKRKGNNYEGISVLRSAYLHWYMKSLLYKIGGVAADRFGVGIPFIKFKKGATSKDIDKYEELVKNIKSNEKGYAVFDDNVLEFSILTPSGNAEKGMMQSMIDHHDRKIYDSILAGFLNLSTGDGGSNALSKDQSSFFLRGLQGNVNYICSKMNELVRELVWFNYGKVDAYPKFKASNIGSISMDEYTNSIVAAKQAGLLSWNERDENAVREQLKMPELPVKDEEDAETELLEQELEAVEAEFNALFENMPEETEEPVDAVEMSEKGKKISEGLKRWWATRKSQGAQKTEQAIGEAKTILANIKAKGSSMGAAAKKAANKALRAAIDKIKGFIKAIPPIDFGLRMNKAIKEIQENTKKRQEALDAAIEEAAGPKKRPAPVEPPPPAPVEPKKPRIQQFATPRPSEREKVFMKHIADYENYLESEYNNHERVVAEAEEKIRKGLVMIYEASEMELVDGQKVFAFSKKNREMQRKALDFIKKIQRQLEDRLIDSPMQKRMFDRTKKMAVEAIKDNFKLLQEIDIEEGAFNSFIAGHTSNMKGVMFNEPRRMSEEVILNYGSQVTVDLAVKQANGIAFNRNVLKLSTVSHARSAYNSVQYFTNSANGFTMYKTVVPKQKLKSVDKFGMTAAVLFSVLTAAEINRRMNKATDGKNTDAVTGLNLHHNAYMYYYPIAAQDLEEERELAKIQRAEFLEDLEN
jgi:hypothetical protein